jgi:D-3-phosphoglycerate dehydrogenase
MTTPRVLIATYPFGQCGREPLDLLEQTGWQLLVPEVRRRLRASEVRERLRDVSAVVAGTEPYTRETLAEAHVLKAICRVGIGLDNVDLQACAERGIAVTYTPDEPSQGVAELTVGNILCLLRHVASSDRSVRAGAWNRHLGRLLSETTIGVVGVGRIGRRVIELLRPFQPTIVACDIDPRARQQAWPCVSWHDLDDVLRMSDLVTLHVPLNETTRGLINRRRLQMMRTGSYLINTSRGAIVDEAALVDALRQRHLEGAALDAFAEEPYKGPLCSLDNALLTAHIGASARRTRFDMELAAAKDCVRVLSGEAPLRPAPA